MPEFEWQTEDTIDWDNLPAIEAAKPASFRHRWWSGIFWWLLPVGLLLAGGWLVWQQLTLRLAEAETEATADLLASHDLLLRAASEQDEDVALSLLSGRDAAWTAMQSDLVAAGLWVERPWLGLTYQAAPAEAVSITFSADLFTAEMVYDIVYQTETAAPIRLQQTAVYRRGADRWLYAPLEAGYWGEWQEQEYPRLTLRYRQRDADLAQRLGPDLSQAVTDLCLLVAGMDCPADFRVRVELDPQPDSLLVWETAVLPHHELAYHYRLPTPSLVGRPLDEAGYQALTQGYVTGLLGGIVADQTDYTCCRQVAIFRALLDYQLSQIGVKTWPVDSVLYEQVVAAGERMLKGQPLFDSWRADDAGGLAAADGWVVYLLVEYLLQETAVQSPAVWQNMLGVGQGHELYTWLETLEIADGIHNYAALADRLWWLAYIQTLAQPTTAPPLPLPAEDLLLACESPTTTTTNRLLRYTPATDRWQIEGSYRGHPVLYAASDREGVLLLERAQPASNWRASWWHNGVSQTLSPPDLSVAMWGYLSPNGRFLAVNQFEEENTYPAVLDLTACDERGCRLQPLAGSILWSPSGRRSLILTGSEDHHLYGTLQPGDNEGQPIRAEPIPLAHNPFWVDDETFGYLTRNVAGQSVAMLVTGDTVRPLFDPDQLPGRVFTVIPHPHQPDQYFLQFSDRDGVWYLVVYNAATQTVVDNLAQMEDGFLPTPFIAGDYLLLRHSPAISAPAINQILVYDMRHEASHFYYLDSDRSWYNYAVAGEWVALLLSQRHLLLTVPRLGYSQLIVHPHLQNCHGLAWVKAAVSTAD